MDLYCKNHPYVTIIIRRREEPSANTADSPPKKASLQARSQLMGTPTRSPRIRPYRRVPSESIDISTREPLSSFSEADQITLELGGDKTETLSKEYLLGKSLHSSCSICQHSNFYVGWIAAEISHGKAATDIVVESEDKRGKLRRIILTESIWQTSLLRGNSAKAEFRRLHEKSEHAKINRSAIIEELSREEQFVANSKLFIRDLRQFGSDPKAQDRLNATGSVFFLGKPYFSEEMIGQILQLPAGSGSLDYALKDLLQRKAERGEGEELCSSHDLAPIYEAAFGYSWKTIKSEFQQQGLPDLARLAITDQPAEQVVGSSNERGKGLRKKASRFFGRGK
jgi:hypothetical protein